MWVLVRAVTYATLFAGLVLVFLPARLVSRYGVPPTPVIGVQQVFGMVIAGIGAAIAVWCLLTFVFLGKGTPAPFDPPRRLVVQGPYRVVRNPMYIGAGFALAGAALFYESVTLLSYVGMLWLVTHAFVILYEEPILRRSFGSEYEAYCGHVGRWWPHL